VKRLLAMSFLFIGALTIAVAASPAGGAEVTVPATCPAGLSPDMQDFLNNLGGGFDGCPQYVPPPPPPAPPSTPACRLGPQEPPNLPFCWQG
jgi:hypothetical protein